MIDVNQLQGMMIGQDQEFWIQNGQMQVTRLPGGFIFTTIRSWFDKEGRECKTATSVFVDEEKVLKT